MCFLSVRCEVACYSRKIRHLHNLVGDVVSDVPPSLLASLLHEELTSQREQQRFCADATGGALGYVPLHESQGYSDGCLIYPSGDAMDKLSILFRSCHVLVFVAMRVSFIKG